MKSLVASLAVATIAASSAAIGQPQEQTWLVCRTTLDVTRFIAPPILVEKADINVLTKIFNKMADDVGNRHVCTAYASRSEIPEEERPGTSYPAAWGGGSISVVAFPNLTQNWGEEFLPERKNATVAPKSPIAEARPVPAKYVEVAGPNGTLRLSPEVAARNVAAAEEYKRKMQEHSEAVARAKADEQANAAKHAADLARHAESVARAAAEKQEYERKLAANAAQTGSPKATMGAKGWMYCDARGAPGDKRRFYSRVTEVDYVPGEVSIIDVMARNRPAFKSYVAGAHSIYFATDSLLHCPYSTTSLADAEALMARDKRGDGNNRIEIIQTGWVPTS